MKKLSFLCKYLETVIQATSEVIYNINANSQLVNQVFSDPVALDMKVEIPVPFWVKTKTKEQRMVHNDI
jgi:hypothetical protein